MRVLVTGAAGYLGRDVCHILAESGIDVLATDQNLRHRLPVPMRVANLLDRFACYQILEGVDIVVHLAGHPRDYTPSIQLGLTENVTLTTNLLQAGVEQGVRRFLFA
ncbi:MAG: NAD(P)-dependent oxidoreductase, partial [Lentisphaerae bacterium]